MRGMLAEWSCYLAKKKSHKLSEFGATGRHSLVTLSSYVFDMKFKGVILNGSLRVSS